MSILYPDTSGWKKQTNAFFCGCDYRVKTDEADQQISRVPNGNFNNEQVNLNWNNPDNVNDNYRSRPSMWVSLEL